MKKTQQILATIISLIILTFFVRTSWADVCVGDYPIYNSTDIADLSGCTEITGNLTIEHTALTSLTGLENIRNVHGSLHIYNNDDLTNLDGLRNILSLGGALEIVDNPSLTSLTELENLTSVGGLIIIENGALTSLSGLDNLTSVDWGLENVSACYRP